MSDGKISTDQETQRLAQLKQRETNFVQNGPPPARGDGDGDRGGVVGIGGLNDVASLLGAAGFGASTDSTTSIGQALQAYGVDTGRLAQISASLSQTFGAGGIDRAA